MWQFKTGVKPYCLEIDPNLLAVIKKRGFKCYQSFDRIKKKFDLIYTSNVLEHIKDDQLALNKLNSKLKDDGQLVIYVQLLAETGIIGFLFLLSLFGYVVYCAFRELQSIVLKKKRYLTDYQVCLLAGILISVWPFSPNGNFFNNWLAIIYSLPIGFYLH